MVRMPAMRTANEPLGFGNVLPRGLLHVLTMLTFWRIFSIKFGLNMRQRRLLQSHISAGVITQRVLVAEASLKADSPSVTSHLLISAPKYYFR
jgi:hypothetical protein